MNQADLLCQKQASLDCFYQEIKKRLMHDEEFRTYFRNFIKEVDGEEASAKRVPHECYCGTVLKDTRECTIVGHYRSLKHRSFLKSRGFPSSIEGIPCATHVFLEVCRSKGHPCFTKDSTLAWRSCTCGRKERTCKKCGVIEPSMSELRGKNDSLDSDNSPSETKKSQQSGEQEDRSSAPPSNIQLSCSLQDSVSQDGEIRGSEGASAVTADDAGSHSRKRRKLSPTSNSNSNGDSNTNNSNNSNSSNNIDSSSCGCQTTSPLNSAASTDEAAAMVLTEIMPRQ